MSAMRPIISMDLNLSHHLIYLLVHLWVILPHPWQVRHVLKGVLNSYMDAIFELIMHKESSTFFARLTTVNHVCMASPQQKYD